jgi:hypothetical protein
VLVIGVNESSSLVAMHYHLLISALCRQSAQHCVPGLIPDGT